MILYRVALILQLKHATVGDVRWNQQDESRDTGVKFGGHYLGKIKWSDVSFTFENKTKIFERRFDTLV